MAGGGTFPFGAHQDGVNQQYSILGVVGTLGTADAGGTARTLPVGVDPTTGALYVNNLGNSGTGGGGGGNPTAGTLNTLGTLGVLQAGTVTVSGGTFNLGTIAISSFLTNLPILTGGTINSDTVVGGTLNVLAAGTINAATAILNSGTINLATVTGNLGTLSMLSAGTVTSVTTVTNLTSGSVRMTVGTLTTGTLQNLVSGTINSATAVLNSGTINVGTFNMPSGTLNVGTVTAQLNPIPIVNTISHAGTSGTLGIGTLVAAIGAGTAMYITNFRIVAISGTPEVILAFGSQTNGNQIIHHGLFPAGGGIANPVVFPHGYGTTNSPLTYQILSGAGTVSWDVDYFAHT